ncbi:MAG: glycosyltransferase, partial [Clostridia bacterium]|nr:glycosyltransferase [Clostridia bacterium]
MQEIKLSIIVPVYNVEKYLGQCLDSLLNQDIDKNEYEIICIDDGSRDASGAILDDYAERYSNIVVVHKENAGVSAARNDALDMARGEYIHFIDSDDYFYPRVYGQLIDLLIREDADVLLFDHEKVAADCFYNESDFTEEKEISEATVYSEVEFSSMVWRNIIKRSLIETHSIRFAKGISYGEDTLFEDFVSCYA